MLSRDSVCCGVPELAGVCGGGLVPASCPGLSAALTLGHEQWAGPLQPSLPSLLRAWPWGNWLTLLPWRGQLAWLLPQPKGLWGNVNPAFTAHSYPQRPQAWKGHLTPPDTVPWRGAWTCILSLYSPEFTVSTTHAATLE